MRKLIGILLIVVMIGLPLDMAFGRGGGGGGRVGGGGGGDRRGAASDRRTNARSGKRDATQKRQQTRRDLCEDKDTCADNNRR